MPRFLTAATSRSIVSVGPWLLGQVVIPSGVLDVRIFRVRRLPRPAIGPADAIAARFDAQSFRVKHLPAAVAALLKEVTMPDDEPAAPSQIPADVEEDEATAVQVDPTVVPPAAKAEADAAPPLRASAPTAAAEARRDALAYAREVSELCVLADFADRAARFITAETSVELVREALLEARAAADARIAIDGSREPRAGRMPASKDAGWGDAVARTFKKPEV